jgi:hypothetical protein
VTEFCEDKTTGSSYCCASLFRGLQLFIRFHWRYFMWVALNLWGVVTAELVTINSSAYAYVCVCVCVCVKLFMTLRPVL